MSSSGGTTPQQVVTQTQSKDPWIQAQPYMQQTMGSAQTLYNAGMGASYNPYSGPTLAPIDPWQQTGMNTAYNLAASEPTGSQNLTDARSYIDQLINNQGMTSNLNDTAAKFNQIYSNASGQQNPYLLAQIADNNQRISNQINSSMSGSGRYGSGQHVDTMSRALAQSADPILAQDYTQRQQQMQQSAGALADLYGQAAQRAGAATQMVPTLDAARYANSDVMSQLGQLNTNRAQQQLQAQIDLYNAQQAYPWESLQRYNAILAGAGAQGGSTVTTGQAPQQPGTLQRILGGGLAGGALGSMFGPVGTGVGAAGGGLLGLL